MSTHKFTFGEVVERARNAFFSMVGVEDLKYEAVDGHEIKVPYEVTLFERGDAAAILLVDWKKRCFVLLRNTRIGWSVSNLRRHKVDCSVQQGRILFQDLTKLSGQTYELLIGQCQLLEIVAGTLDAAKGPANLVRDEVLEEAGYAEVTGVQSLGEFVPSPGASTEIIYLYVGYVAGEAQEVEHKALEDGMVVHLPFNQVWAAIESGQIIDGKTLTAILKFMWMNPNLFR